jgi:hypothetical protein
MGLFFATQFLGEDIHAEAKARASRLLVTRRRSWRTFNYLGFEEIPQPQATEQKEELPWQ